LYAIARSRCLRRIADRKRQRPTEDLEPLSPPAAAPADEVERAEQQRLVWQAAAGLAPADRAVLDLHLRQGLSGAPLADALGVPAEKANLMLHRVKQRMARTIGALLVARTGRDDCPDLAAIAGGELTPLIRKRLSRHIERCRVCLARRDRLAPELVYASVPLAVAPLAIGERITGLIELSESSGATTAAGEGMRWNRDGFPQPDGTGVPMPVPQRLAVGTGIAALVTLGLFAGLATGRAIGGGEPSAVGPLPATATATATAGPPAAPPTATAPAVVVPPPIGGTALPSPPGASPTATSPPSSPAPSGPPDVTAPLLSPLRVGACGLTFTAEVDVTDSIDPAPTGDLLLSWDAGPGSPVPMTHVGGGTYRAVVTRQGDARGFVVFKASGTVTDAAGNSAFRQVSRSCTPIVD
jgi:hypothetical protein